MSNKKHNISDLREACGVCCAPAVVDFHGLKISIEQNISVKDRVDLINTVVENCLRTQEPIAVFDYMFRFCVVEWFTDIDLSDAGENEDVLVKSDILDIISINAAYCSIHDLREDCRLELDRCLRYIENPIVKLSDEIIEWLDLMKESTDGFDIGRLENLIANVRDVSPDNIVDIVSRMHDGNEPHEDI